MRWTEAGCDAGSLLTVTLRAGGQVKKQVQVWNSFQFFQGNLQLLVHLTSKLRPATVGTQKALHWPPVVLKTNRADPSVNCCAYQKPLYVDCCKSLGTYLCIYAKAQLKNHPKGKVCDPSGAYSCFFHNCFCTTQLESIMYMYHFIWTVNYTVCVRKAVSHGFLGAGFRIPDMYLHMYVRVHIFF